MAALENAYRVLYNIALIVLAILIGIMLVRAVIGPRVTDRILSINMIGTMVICSIAVFSQLFEEGYLLDIALIYALISFVTILVFAMVYIPSKPKRDMYYDPKNRRAKRLLETKTGPSRTAGREQTDQTGHVEGEEL